MYSLAYKLLKLALLLLLLLLQLKELSPPWMYKKLNIALLAITRQSDA